MVFSKFDWYRSLAGADISDTEFRVLVLLANYADGKTGGNAHPSAAKLAADTGKSAKTVRRALASLVASGWLTKVERNGSSSVYQLATRDARMSRVTERDPGLLGVQGSEPTLDKWGPTLDTQMSNLPGHLDVHRLDQGSDPLRIRSFLGDRSDQGGENIGDVHPLTDQDETDLKVGSLAVAGSEAAGSDSDPWGSTSEPATGYEEDPVTDEGERRDAREQRALRLPTPVGSGHQPDWPPPRRAGRKPARRTFGEYSDSAVSEN